jgi:hypothetical protein
MKRCTVCGKLADNGDKRCHKCGTPFIYDPKVSPFSEIRIALICLGLVLLGFFIYQSLPMQPPDPTVCSRTSYIRFKSIVVKSHRDTLNILAENYISAKQLSEIMKNKHAAEALSVPACLEKAKADYVNYLDALYYTAVLSAWNGYEPAAKTVESAAGYLDALQADMDEVNACLPNCQ